MNEAYQGEDSRPRSDEEMEEGDILNSIEDFADYGSGKTFLSVNLNCYSLHNSNRKNVCTKRVVPRRLYFPALQ